MFVPFTSLEDLYVFHLCKTDMSTGSLIAFDSLVYGHFACLCSVLCVQLQAVCMLLYRTDLTFAPLANPCCHLHSRQAEIVTVWSTLRLYQGFSEGFLMWCVCVCGTVRLQTSIELLIQGGRCFSVCVLERQSETSCELDQW